MVALVLCNACAFNDHHPGEARTQTIPGLLGGWACSCRCVGGEVPPDRPTPLDRLLDQKGPACRECGDTGEVTSHYDCDGRHTRPCGECARGKVKKWEKHA